MSVRCDLENNDGVGNEICVEKKNNQGAGNTLDQYKIIKKRKRSKLEFKKLILGIDLIITSKKDNIYE